MAVITNLATLETAVADYLAKSNLTTFVPNFVQNTENKVYRKYNIRDMETAFSGTISSGVLALPTRYNALKRAQVDTNPIVQLKRRPLDWIYEEYPSRTGGQTPVFISQEAGSFVFGPYPSDVEISGVYYRRYEPLRTTDPNWYVTNAPEVLLYGSLLEAEPFIKNDPRLPLWRSMFADAISTIVDSEREETMSGSGLEIFAA